MPMKQDVVKRFTFSQYWEKFSLTIVKWSSFLEHYNAPGGNEKMRVQHCRDLQWWCEIQTQLKCCKPLFPVPFSTFKMQA